MTLAGSWPDERAVVRAATDGDEAAFATLAEHYRPALRAHCYRMVASLHDAEDLVQETFLRAWRGRTQFTDHGPSSYRSWLYRIATNACLDLLRRRPRTPFPWQRGARREASGTLLSPSDEYAWLEPYPDRLLDEMTATEQPEAKILARDAIELAFIAAVQLLPPMQRAVLVLRDVVGCSAKEVASQLDRSVPAVNSALQRARATLREELPERGSEWTPAARPSADERAVVGRYLDAHQRRDFDALAALLRADARLTMPPTPSWFEGRDAIVDLFRSWLDPGSPAFVGDVRQVPIEANRQLGSAAYLRRPDDTMFRRLGLEVLRVADGCVAEVTMFVSGDLFDAFGLPDTL